jgi:hypothetical protein
MYRKLAPGPWFNTVPLNEYPRLCDIEILGVLDAARVRDDLLRLADGRVPVLCCFDRVGPGQWCHRAIAAQWLADALGILVPEVRFEAAPVHPLSLANQSVRFL